MKVNHGSKLSLAPGSQVVTDYLEKAGLNKYLDQLGFNLVGYGCTTCIGNSGPLDKEFRILFSKKIYMLFQCYQEIEILKVELILMLKLII